MDKGEKMGKGKRMENGADQIDGLLNYLLSIYTTEVFTQNI